MDCACRLTHCLADDVYIIEKVISRVTDAVLGEVTDWQNRALERMYPIVFFDALRVKIRDTESRQVKNKAVYVALGVNSDGEREVLGLWIANNEGAKFWLSMMLFGVMLRKHLPASGITCAIAA